MLVHPTNKHGVLFNEAESRGSFARPGKDARVSVGADKRKEVMGSGCDARGAGEDVEGETLAEEDAAGRAGDGGDGEFGLWREEGAFDVVPLDGAGELAEDFVGKGDAREDALRFVSKGWVNM